jgi:uncharacterized protein YndB with AHSA1/START domain
LLFCSGGSSSFPLDRQKRPVRSSRIASRADDRWTWDGHGAHQGTNLVEVEFRDAWDGTTLVVLTNRGLPPDVEAKRAHREGWQASLDNLERIVRE